LPILDAYIVTALMFTIGGNEISVRHWLNPLIVHTIIHEKLVKVKGLDCFASPLISLIAELSFSLPIDLRVDHVFAWGVFAKLAFVFQPIDWITIRTP